MSKPTMPKAIRPRKKKPHEVEPWYRRYPRDWMEDTRELKLPERGAYNDIIDMIYMTGGPIPGDDQYIAHRLHVHVNTWRPIRRRLLHGGFLYVTCGKLMNKRCKEIIEERQRQLNAMGRGGSQRPDTPPDLFEIDSDYNGPDTSRSVRSDQEEDSEIDQRKFAPRVIEGGRTVDKRDRPAPIPPKFVSEDAMDKVLEIAPGWDRQALYRKWLDWNGGTLDGVKRPDKAFLSWVASYTKGEAAS